MSQTTSAALRSFFSEMIYAFSRNKISWIGLVLLVLMILMALLAPVLSPYNPVEQHIIDRFKAPGVKYWLGTDEYGRDILSRIIWGSRISLTVGTISVLMDADRGGPRDLRRLPGRILG